MPFLHTPETLATLTQTDLEREVHRLRQLGYELDRQLFEMSSLQEHSLDSKVKRLLPRLSRSVRRTLAQVHPEFMTPERLSVFQAQLPLLGLWPRAGHGEALSHLRTEFRAHLAQEREKAGESKLLDELAGQKSQVTQALQWVQAELQRREAQAPLPSDAQGLGTRGDLPAYLAQRKGPFA